MLAYHEDSACHLTCPNAIGTDQLDGTKLIPNLRRWFGFVSRHHQLAERAASPNDLYPSVESPQIDAELRATSANRLQVTNGLTLAQR